MPLFKHRFASRPDEDLMRLLARGSKGAFRVIFDRYQTKMFRFFYRMLGGCEEKANDFTQDLFLKVIEKPGAFDTSRLFSSWIYTVAHNMVKNEYRRMSRAPEMTGLEKVDFELGHSGDFTEGIDDELRQEKLRQAIGELSPKHRTCFVLRHYEGLDIKSISEILDCPEGTVKSRLFYALNDLSGKLRAYTHSTL